MPNSGRKLSLFRILIPHTSSQGSDLCVKCRFTLLEWVVKQLSLKYQGQTKESLSARLTHRVFHIRIKERGAFQILVYKGSKSCFKSLLTFLNRRICFCSFIQSTPMKSFYSWIKSLVKRIFL